MSLHFTPAARHRAAPGRPSYLEARGLLATPGYVGRRRRLTEADTLVLGTVA